ncbi:Stonustoxin subunit beta [Labeo rohita]|uniref:Stonustoxin subunit beta n=1 Tax=Labeo rohita TaxID=84645 RepID=A0ABQ8LCP7_LABRO|nr:Stonustoxin subunit beta [Labeo rohita]
METKHLGDDPKQSMQMKYSGLATCPIYTSPNPIIITAQRLGRGTKSHYKQKIQSGTGQQKPGHLVALLNVRDMEIHSPTNNRPIVDHGGESRITAGLKKYGCFLTLDPNTANKRLILSEENRKVTYGNQSYPDHPDRFDGLSRQVLCRESVCGRCYWEIEWSGHVGVFISVSYKSISRKKQGVECRFGYNDQSWSLIFSRNRYSFKHNKIETDLPVNPISRRVGVSDIYRVGVSDDDDDDDNIYRVGVSDYIYRVGVYVDVSAGTLSFYSVSRNTMSLIHTEQITFTQTLYPGFFVYPGSSVSLC